MIIDARTRNRILDYMPKQDIMRKLENFFDIFSDNTRLKIISMLLVSSMCVTDISEIVGLNQTTISHQLKTLKQAGIVESTRQGKVVFYSVSNERVGDVLLYGIEYLGY